MVQLTQPRSGQTRAIILRSAERIFSEAGLAGARTDEIARAAGVNKALLYYYFRSKEGLYLEVLEDNLREFRRQMEEILGSPSPPAKRILNYVDAYLDFLGARPHYPQLIYRFMMASGRPLERLARKYFHPVGHKLIRVIEQGIQEGELRPVDPPETVLALAGLITFYFSVAPVRRLVTRINPYSDRELARHKKEVHEFVRYALLRHPEKPLP